MNIINELWYGNISPFEQCTRGDKRLKELLKLVARNREGLGPWGAVDKASQTIEMIRSSFQCVCQKQKNGLIYS